MGQYSTCWDLGASAHRYSTFSSLFMLLGGFLATCFLVPGTFSLTWPLPFYHFLLIIHCRDLSVDVQKSAIDSLSPGCLMQGTVVTRLLRGQECHSASRQPARRKPLTTPDLAPDTSQSRGSDGLEITQSP
jgi:hypothetical protein